MHISFLCKHVPFSSCRRCCSWAECDKSHGSSIFTPQLILQIAETGLALCFWAVCTYSKRCVRVCVCVCESHDLWWDFIIHIFQRHRRRMYNSYLWLGLERDACLLAFPSAPYTPTCQVRPFIYSNQVSALLVSHIESVIVESALLAFWHLWLPCQDD